jgi:isoaspartyl peptidase/L-asparaginase-like protein (Ntn-hydrolase superfamily)
LPSSKHLLTHCESFVCVSAKRIRQLETVVYAVSLLEDDELFNAGIGSQIQSRMEKSE